ncbi:hypothetical protein BCR32DRAFT_300618 [Anaeromyces robustus]|uniref:BD-FAE-like domain-containing protein n=1 Tax=Anaeromyces robustus TaxID=1754192 RepID=A0A1Y1X224_9FUNG|nr:hypothetical protein BCR32DRAFT_300618 [Anaeromyces robustus]|eukprot:ORX79859.1 hypothetical protein BCR32DRAFT_300618 [Anaeromyces robustus]
MKTIYFTYVLVLLFVLGIKAKAIIENNDNELIKKEEQEEMLLAENDSNDVVEVDNDVNLEDEVDSNVELEDDVDSNVELEDEVDSNVELENEVDSSIEEESKTPAAELVDTYEVALEFYENYENIAKNITYNNDGKTLDVYYNPADINTKKPVNIYIFGGSWVANDKVRFTRLGALLERENYIGIIPDFALYPNGLFEDMVDDVYQAIQWTYNNIEQYGGDKDNIILTGHSSGAHLAALTVIKAGLGLENNRVKLEPLPYLKRVVLMNGPYIFNQEFIVYTLGGSTDTSNATSTSDPEEQALLTELIGIYMNKDEVSPIQILKQYEDNSIINNFNVEKFIFVYCSEDKTIPEFSALQLIDEITRTSQSPYEYINLQGLEHPSVINGIKTEKEEFEKIYMDIIRK